MTHGSDGTSTVEIAIPNESFRAVFIEMVFRGGEGLHMTAPETVLATGTGFFYRVDGVDYLITARHNFTGRHWQTNQLMYTAHAVDPTHVRVRVRERLLETLELDDHRSLRYASPKTLIVPPRASKRPPSAPTAGPASLA
jgi:hypothetical protein